MYLKIISNKYFIYILVFCLFFLASELINAQGKSLSQKSSDIKRRQADIKNLNESINRTRKELQVLSKKEHDEINILYKYQSHITSVNKYINLLDQEINLLQDSIDYLKKMIKLAGKNRLDIKKEFTELARKKLLDEDLTFDELLIADKRYSSNIIEKELLSRITEQTKNKVNEIKNFMDSTHQLVIMLYEKSNRQEQIKIVKNQEKIKLNQSVETKQKLLKRIRSDKKLLEKQLKQKEQSLRALKDIITKMAQNDRLAVKPDKKTTYVVSSILFSWPVNNRKILRGFGQYTNIETNTVFDNPGIDIATPSGSLVLASAPGTVTLIHWLPGFNSLIIIDHGNELRSVYANLSSVNVSQGMKVTRGQVIGKSGESVDGEFLHFELWNGSRRLNPINYLR